MDSCVSSDVDLEALNSPFWQTKALEFTTPPPEQEEGRNKSKETLGTETGNEASYLEFNAVVLPAEVS